ncbi:hypothetical protein COLO4_17913 [Corchorus olitorius]|uniref:Myb/SANT-like DNA-binding domain-containing protein n=1 Tax=Corchorus olitorius TaxID=93759 RepID=A0A1R3JB35_9ROSI|nr:hypothetical protein COLO4_17913 [Corchorus olitorius]
MEGQPSAGGNMLQGWAYCSPDLQGSMQLRPEEKTCMLQLPSASGLVENESQESLIIEDDVTNYAEQGMLEQNEVGKSEGGPPWQRMKWTRNMVKLLITILSYIEEDPSTDYVGSQRKMSFLLRKVGKWKCVSKVMVKKGYRVSPQQCEDKFNNLNKTYRRLNDLLGKGTSCKVVENPRLLDMINVSEKGKEDARKILTSKHLFFEEMCSYHNGNRLFLPHDPDLLQSLLTILKNEDDCELNDLSQPVFDTAEDNGLTSGFLEFSEKWSKLMNENHAGFENPSNQLDSNQPLDSQCDIADQHTGANSGFPAVSAMLLKQTNEKEVAGPENPSKPWDCDQISDAQPLYDLTHQSLSFPESSEPDESQEQEMAERIYELQKQRLQLKCKLLELEKQRYKWQNNSCKLDLEVDNMRLQNKCLKLGNDFLAMRLKRRKMDLDRS